MENVFLGEKKRIVCFDADLNRYGFDEVLKKEVFVMYISMNIIQNCLKEYILLENIRPEADMSIDYYELYEAGGCSYKKNCIYILIAEELASPENIPEASNLICVGWPEKFDIESYRHVNILIMGNLSYKQQCNLIISIFKKYQRLDIKLDTLISNNASLQEIIDLSTEIIKVPLCMLDLNHNVLAISSHLDSPDDPLWMAMKEGYGYSHYEIVKKSEPKLKNMEHPSKASVEMISNISGHYIRVNTLFRGKQAVSALGMHKLGDYRKPFAKHTVQLYEYIIQKLTKRLSLFLDVKIGRGILYEEFLRDILSGKIYNSVEIEKETQHLGIKIQGKNQMGLISFKEGVIRTDHHFAMMDYLEMIIPNSKCTMMGSNIIMICPITHGYYLDKAMQDKLVAFLQTYECFCVLSPVFLALNEIPEIYNFLKLLLPLLDTNKSKPNIFHYYEYSELYSMQFFAETVPKNVLRHPNMQILIEHDKELNMDLVNTLKTYLRNNCNVSVVAQLLHMHRNTVLYRIKRIENLLESDFEDWETRRQLLFSMAYIEYMENKD